MRMEPTQPIEIKDGDFIEVVDKTIAFGCAEFAICPIYKRGKLVELHIFRVQQKN